MKKPEMAIWMVAGALLMAVAAPAFAQNENSEGHGRAVVTVLAGKHGVQAPDISLRDLSVKVNGKEAQALRWTPLRVPDDRLELVVLIDSTSRNMNGGYFREITQFVESLPQNTKVAIAYMENGRAVLTGPLTADHAQAAKGLHLPIGVSDCPYFSVSDLAHHWPSAERGVRREVLLLTNGVDPYNLRYDPDNLYLQNAIADSVRAGLAVDSIFWNGWYGTRLPLAVLTGGQNLLQELSLATGGKSYGFGMGNPVSFQPYLEDLALRLKNQYELEFAVRLEGKPAIETLKLKAHGSSAGVDAPERVFVHRAPLAAE